jgi:beta-phosphoglucomutase-like phosphatase (HAD superfamily)
MTSTRNFKAILWDMDGTLADTEPLHMHTLITALADHGVQAGSELHPLVFGKTGREVHALCRERFGIVTDYDTWSLFRARCYLAAAPSIEPRAGALEVYRAAGVAGVAQAIVSNASRMLLEANLAALGLQTPPLVTVSVNDVRNGKPDPEPYLRAAWLLRVDPDDAIVVEDSPTGAAAALAAGMRVLGWPLEEADVSLFSPDVRIVRSASELAGALDLSFELLPAS